MPRSQTLVQLTDELVAALDREAVRLGMSRSALVREAVVAYLADTTEAAISKQIVDGYTRMPPGVPDEWGDLGTQADTATRETMQRLDAEDRERDAW